jgi:exodeoxyribonuclease VII small subunit
MNKDISLEEAFLQVEESLKQLESENISLEDSFKVYHKGIALLKTCNDRIARVEKQILIMNEKGELDEF